MTEASIMSVTLLIASMSAAKPISTDQLNANAVGVCDVLSNPTSFNAKEIEIRGVRRSGPHGQWLEPFRPPCASPLVTEGFVWPSRVDLVEDRASKLDLDSLARMDMQIETVSGKRGQYSVIVTYVGVLATRAPLRVVHYPKGEVRPNGFGHMNAYPAQLRYKAVKDVVIQQNR